MPKKNREINELPQQKIETKQSVKAKGKKASLRNIEDAMDYLRNNFDIRYNIMANEVEYKRKDEKDYKYFDDFEYNSLHLEINLEGIDLAENKFRQIIASRFIAEKYDPFKEYLKALPVWDGKEDHIKTFLQQIYLTKESDRDYFIIGFKKWFVGLVMSLWIDIPDQRFVNQFALILIGREQGKYKSTWLGSIIPEEFRLKYYYQSSFNPHNKDHEKYLATKVLINFDEMAAFNKTDIETIKSKITQGQVSLRLPYAKGDIHLKRRASFCGSINDRQFLRDETGSRRWFVIEVDSIAYNANFDISLIWAQAFTMFKNDYKWWLDGDDIRKLEDRNQEFTEMSMEEEYLLEMFDKPTPQEITEGALYLRHYTTSQIADRIANDKERMNINNSVKRLLGKALTKHKFPRVSKSKVSATGSPGYVWIVKNSGEGQQSLPKNSESANLDDII
jgi:predicted P-loop ATPase